MTHHDSGEDPPGTQPPEPSFVGHAPDAAEPAPAPAHAPAPVKVCRRCSVQTATHAAVCPHCGTRYARRRRPSRRTRRIAVVLAVLLMVGGAGVGVSLAVQHQQQELAAQAAAEERQARQEAERQAQREAEELERTLRSSLVDSLEASILEDAKGYVDDGVLTGPILRATCTPVAGGSTSDLTALTGSFDCIAVNEEHQDGTASGYRFSATTNWDEYSYSWHLGG